MAITAQDGGFAFVSGGAQSIAITGGSLDLETRSGGGFVSLTSGANQSISVRNGEHISVNAAGGGSAWVSAASTQTLSITGSGRNAIVIGSEGALGSSNVLALGQSVTAGLEGESGSITFIGPVASGGGAAMFTNSGSAHSQTVSTTGAIDITGGSVAFGGVSGIFHNSSGQQTIDAGRIAARGGAAGVNNGAFITSNGADQVVTVSGDVELVGGTGGFAGINVNPIFASRQTHQIINAANIRVLAGPGNGATINSNGRGGQTINVSGDIDVAGGASSNASISTVGPDAIQTINARNINLTNAPSSAGNSAGVIQGTHQRIDATGNVILTARAAQGDFSGARIGGASGSTTDLDLTVGGNLILTGGTAGLNGAALGGSVTGAALNNNIVIRAGGEVILDGGTGGAGVRIGSTPRTGIAGGHVSIAARNVQFLGNEPATIRTLGNVELHAGEIIQGPSGFIIADGFTTSSHGSTSLGGPNQVSSFSGSSATGHISLRNSSPLLTLGMVNAPGALSIDQGGSILIRGGDASDAPTIVRGGLVKVATGGDLRLVGGNGDNSHALLLSGGNIDLTVGGTLRLDEGSGKFSWAKIQTESRDAVINLAFPNLSSRGFYVNGVEGDTKDGKTGFFIFHKPARIGDTLILEYGQ